MNELERLLVERACARIVIESAVANDERRWADLAALYTLDGVVIRPNGQRLQGQQAIEAAYAAGPPDRVTRHLCTNVQVDVVDRDSVRVTTTVLIIAGVRSEEADATFGVVPNDHHAVGRFADRLVLTEEGWRIAERQATVSLTT